MNKLKPMDKDHIARVHRSIDQVIERGGGSTIIGFVALTNKDGGMRIIWGTADDGEIRHYKTQLVIGLLNSLRGQYIDQKLYRSDTGEEIGGENQAPPV